MIPDPTDSDVAPDGSRAVFAARDRMTPAQIDALNRHIDAITQPDDDETTGEMLDNPGTEHAE